jgi:hypothetical protein
MRRILATTLPLLLALGCDGGEAPERNVTKIVVNKDNPYHEKLLALNEANRNLALRRAVKDDGGRCSRIQDSAYQQEYQGMAMWIARCTGEDWAVFLAPGGYVQVRACKHAGQLGLPECRGAAKDAGTEPVWPTQANPLPPATTR